MLNSKLRIVICLFAVGLFIGCSSPASSNTSSAKAITSFSIIGSSATISGTTITVNLPYYPINVSALIATFVTTGNLVTVNGIAQVSGSTINNFTHPVTYLVTAQDGSTASYTVTVILPTICATDAGCAPGFFCNGAQACVAKGVNGASCSANNQCVSGNCSGGTCQ